MDNNTKLVHLNTTSKDTSRKQKIALLKSVAAGEPLTPEKIEKIYGSQPDYIISKEENDKMIQEAKNTPPEEWVDEIEYQTEERRQWAENIKFEEQADGSCFV